MVTDLRTTVNSHAHCVIYLLERSRMRNGLATQQCDISTSYGIPIPAIPSLHLIIRAHTVTVLLTLGRELRHHPCYLEITAGVSIVDCSISG